VISTARTALIFPISDRCPMRWTSSRRIPRPAGTDSFLLCGSEFIYALYHSGDDKHYATLHFLPYLAAAFSRSSFFPEELADISAASLAGHFTVARIRKSDDPVARPH